MRSQTKEVYFNIYCPQCVHYSKAESEDPCWDCLENGYNFDSHRPVKFKNKDEEVKNESV